LLLIVCNGTASADDDGAEATAYNRPAAGHNVLILAPLLVTLIELINAEERTLNEHRSRIERLFRQPQQ
jgi:hypothetical protein